MDDNRNAKLEHYNEIAEHIKAILVLSGLDPENGMVGSFFIVAEHVIMDDDIGSYSNYSLLPRGGYLPSHVLKGLFGEAKEMLFEAPIPVMYGGLEHDDEEDGEDLV